MSKLAYLDRMQFFTTARASFAQQIIAYNLLSKKCGQVGLDHIIKRFHEENSIMSALFSQTNLLLCGMQGNNGLLTKTLKKNSKITYTASRFLLLTGAKFAVRAANV